MVVAFVVTVAFLILFMLANTAVESAVSGFSTVSAYQVRVASCTWVLRLVALVIWSVASFGLTVVRLGCRAARLLLWLRRRCSAVGLVSLWWGLVSTGWFGSVPYRQVGPNHTYVGLFFSYEGCIHALSWLRLVFRVSRLEVSEQCFDLWCLSRKIGHRVATLPS